MVKAWLCKLAVFSGLVCGLGPACQTMPPLATYGLQADGEGYIPARIAVLPCTSWPQTAAYPSLPLAAAVPAVTQTLCTQFDAHVLKSFAGQPFMKGYTPTLIAKLLAKAGKPDFLAALPSLWHHKSQNCPSCKSAPAVYAASVAPQPSWRAWLQELSAMTQLSDAVLIPFVLFAHEQQYNDRGLLVTARSAAVALFLVDSASGKLLWSGGRQGAIQAQQLHAADKSTYPDPPPWEELPPRLFHNNLWQGFPGKQWY